MKKMSNSWINGKQTKRKIKVTFWFSGINFQVFKADVKYSDMFKPSPQTEDQPTHVKFPRINTNAIDRILKDSDDEDESKEED